MCAGKLTPHRALMTGRMLVKGNMLRAMRSGPLFDLLRPPLRSTRQQQRQRDDAGRGGGERRELPQARL